MSTPNKIVKVGIMPLADFKKYTLAVAKGDPDFQIYVNKISTPQ